MARGRDKGSSGRPPSGAGGGNRSSRRSGSSPAGATAGTSARGRQGYAVGSGGSTPRRGVDRRLVMVLGTVGTLLVLAVGAWLVLFRDNASGFEDALAAGGCVERTDPNEGAGNHLTDDEAPPKYPTDPPTQGPHRQVAALWGIYDEPIEQARLVHNLEHGGLVVQYGDDVPAEQVDAIKRDVLANRDLTVVAPYPVLGSKIAYTMWTRQIMCQRFEQGVIDELQKARNQPPAPEVPQNPALGRRPGY